MRRLYSGLFYLAVPLILLRLGWRGIKAPAYHRRWGERFGLYSGPASQGPIWFHAVSVGEAEAAFPLIRAVAGHFPQRPILVTTTTPTGSARVHSVLGDEVQHVYLPYDLPGSVARFLDRFRPSMAVIMETEIWPNLYHACGLRGIPLAIVNARLSERSARGYARLPSLTRDCLASVNLIAAQTETDAARFLRIGASADAVRVTGNIKFDQRLSPGWAEEVSRLRFHLFGERPLLIAGSTHEGEEPLLLKAFENIRGHYPGVGLILAPRHPERFAGVEALCLSRGLRVERRSSGRTAQEADVFLLDTLGELRLFYAAGDVAFVGGSFVPVGGHNVLEPAAAGVPVLFGPHTFNFDEASRRLLEAGGGQRVADAAELVQALRHLLDSSDRRKEMGNRGQSFVEAGRGALDRIVEQLGSLLSDASCSPKASDAS